MKQDNRPRKTPSDDTWETLIDLLHDDPSSSAPQTETPVKEQETKKIFFISVHGNNNVVSTEKSRYTAHGFGKRTSFAVVIGVCLLFF